MKSNVLARRQALGITQTELARRARVSQSLISDAENGNRVKPEFLRKIEDALTSAENPTGNSSDPRESPSSDVSSGQHEQTHSNDGTMNAQRHLSAVHPVAASSQLAPDVEVALGAAFSAPRHRVSDLLAVQRVASRLPTDGRAPTELQTLFAALLDAAARLRDRDEPISAESLLVETIAAQTKTRRGA